MAAIHDLLAQVQDEVLRARLEQEINRLSKTKKFGWCLKSTCRSAHRSMTSQSREDLRLRRKLVLSARCTR